MALAITSGKLLEDARKETGRTQEQLADEYKARVGKGSMVQVTRWLRDKSRIKIEDFCVLATILNEWLDADGSDYPRIPVPLLSVIDSGPGDIAKGG